MTWLFALSARAEPVALRAVEPGVALAAGTRSLSVAAPLQDWQVAADFGYDGLVVGLSLGRRAVLAELGPWRCTAGASLGVLAVPYARSVALTAVPWVRGGLQGERAAFVGTLAVPAAAGPRAGVRLPVTLELMGGARAGPVWVLPFVSAGPVYTPGLDLSLAAEAGLVLSWADRG